MVAVVFKFEDESLYQHYIANEKLNHEKYGDCCGQTRCFACIVEYYEVRYYSSVEIDTQAHEKILEIVCSKQIEHLDNLIGICLEDCDSMSDTSGSEWT